MTTDWASLALHPVAPAWPLRFFLPANRPFVLPHLRQMGIEPPLSDEADFEALIFARHFMRCA
jgi:hypothetical protein